MKKLNVVTQRATRLQVISIKPTESTKRRNSVLIIDDNCIDAGTEDGDRKYDAGALSFALSLSDFSFFQVNIRLKTAAWCSSWRGASSSGDSAGVVTIEEGMLLILNALHVNPRDFCDAGIMIVLVIFPCIC